MDRPTPPSRLLRALLVVCALTTGAAHDAEATDGPSVPAAEARAIERVLVVRSGDEELYRHVAAGVVAGLEESFAGPDAPPSPPRVAQRSLEAVGEAEVRAASAAGTLFVAVGSRAARWLAEHLTEEQPLVYVFTSLYEVPQLETRRATAGMRAEIPVAEQIAVVRRVMPDARGLRVGMLFNASDRASTARRAWLEASLPEGWSLEAVDVASYATAAEAVAELLSRRIGLVWTASDRSTLPETTFIHLLDETMKARIPLFGYSHGCVRAGAAFGVGYRLRDQITSAVELIRVMLSDPPAGSAAELHRHPAAELSINRLSAALLDLSLPEPAHLAEARWFPAGRDEEDD